MTQKTEINESVKPSHFAVRIVNNKTGEEKPTHSLLMY